MYKKTIWEDKVTLVDAEKLNNIEDALDKNYKDISNIENEFKKEKIEVNLKNKLNDMSKLKNGCFKLNEIRGNTLYRYKNDVYSKYLIINLVKEAYFSEDNNYSWEVQNASEYYLQDSFAVFKPNAKFSSCRQAIDIDKSHKFYMSTKIKTTSKNTRLTLTSGDKVLSTDNVEPTIEESHKLVSTICNFSEIEDKPVYIAVTCYDEKDFVDINFKDIMLVDLTEMFGKGKEPIKEWCDANIPFVYKIDGFRSCGEDEKQININSIGNNLFNKKKAKKGYVKDGYFYRPSSTDKGYTDFIPVFKDKEYYKTSENQDCFLYDIYQTFVCNLGNSNLFSPNIDGYIVSNFEWDKIDSLFIGAASDPLLSEDYIENQMVFPCSLKRISDTVFDQIKNGTVIINIKKCVLTGKEQYKYIPTNDASKYCCFSIKIDMGKKNSEILSDRFRTIKTLGEYEGVFSSEDETSLVVYISISKQALSSYGLVENDSSTFLQAFLWWLDDENVTILYESKQPIQYTEKFNNMTIFPNIKHVMFDNIVIPSNTFIEYPSTINSSIDFISNKIENNIHSINDKIGAEDSTFPEELKNKTILDMIKINFQKAVDGLKSIVSEIGLPLTANTSHKSVSESILVLKGTLAANLSKLGQASSNKESLPTLIDKVSKIELGYKDNDIIPKDKIDVKYDLLGCFFLNASSVFFSNMSRTDIPMQFNPYTKKGKFQSRNSWSAIYVLNVELDSNEFEVRTIYDKDLDKSDTYRYYNWTLSNIDCYIEMEHNRGIKMQYAGGFKTLASPSNFNEVSQLFVDPINGNYLVRLGSYGDSTKFFIYNKNGEPIWSYKPMENPSKVLYLYDGIIYFRNKAVDYINNLDEFIFPENLKDHDTYLLTHEKIAFVKGTQVVIYDVVKEETVKVFFVKDNISEISCKDDIMLVRHTRGHLAKYNIDGTLIQDIKIEDTTRNCGTIAILDDGFLIFTSAYYDGRQNIEVLRYIDFKNIKEVKIKK